MIPALMIMLLIMLCGFLPALNLVGEKERGTIEQINVTPVGRLTFTLAKLIPYWIIGLAVLTVAMSLAWLVYGLTPVGAVGAVYLAAIGGAGALMAGSVQSCEIIAWPDLGCEAVRKLVVKDFPLTVLLDTHGGDLYQSGPAAYLASREHNA